MLMTLHIFLAQSELNRNMTKIRFMKSKFQIYLFCLHLFAYLTFLSIYLHIVIISRFNSIFLIS